MRYSTQPLAICCVWKRGWDADAFAPEYIRRWAEALSEYPVDPYLLTDTDLEIPGVTSIPLQYPQLQGWHAKFEVFQHFQEYSRAMFTDMDILFTGDLRGLLSVDSDMAMLRDSFYPQTCNSSLMLWHPSERKYILEKALADPPKRSQGDQGLIEAWARERGGIDIFQDYFYIPSYKGDYLRNGKMLPGPIMFFHGKPRPHELNWELPPPSECKQRIRVGSNRTRAIGAAAPPKPALEAPISQCWRIVTDEHPYDYELDDTTTLAVNSTQPADVLLITSQSFMRENEKYCYSFKEQGKPVYSNCCRKLGLVQQVSSGMPRRSRVVAKNGCAELAGLSLAYSRGAQVVSVYVPAEAWKLHGDKITKQAPQLQIKNLNEEGLPPAEPLIPELPTEQPQIGKDIDTVFIVGGGASLREAEDGLFWENLIRPEDTVIGVNDAMLCSPLVDIGFFGDASWYKAHKEDTDKLDIPVYTITRGCGKCKALQTASAGLPSNKLGWNRNSGFAALSLSLLLGAKTVYLLGFDMQDTGGKSHWYNEKNHLAPANTYKAHCTSLHLIKADLEKWRVPVYICGRSSALTCFPVRTFEEVNGR